MNKKYSQDKTLWQGHPDKITSLFKELLAHGSVLYIVLYIAVLFLIISTFLKIIKNPIELTVIIFILVIPVIYFIIKTIINYKKIKNTTYIITNKRITIISKNNKKTSTYYFYDIESIEMYESILDKMFKTRDILINLYPKNKRITFYKVKEYEQIYELLNQVKLKNATLRTIGGIN